MTNKEIAGLFKLTASILELHDENPFKIKGYQSAAFNIEKINQNLIELTEEQLLSIEGISKNLVTKIRTIQESGSFEELEKLLQQTPAGVIEMLEIPGIGPKKVRVIWKELKVETKRDLLEACNRDDLANLKGFGKKTQETIINGLLYATENEGKYLFAEVENFATSLLELLKKSLPNHSIALVGQVARKLEVIDELCFLVETDNATDVYSTINTLSFLDFNPLDSSPFVWRGRDKELNLAIKIKCYARNFQKQVFIHSSGLGHLAAKSNNKTILQWARELQYDSDEVFYNQLNYHTIPPESREGLSELAWTKDKPVPELIENTHLKGVLHNHSTYSDGKDTILEMAQACIDRGYEYFGISDHSVTAYYAGGLDEDRIHQQQREIDDINSKLTNFTVFKGIESDILNDGSLDYSTEVLKTFDFIVASIHSNLKMDKETATARLIKAIENPYTTFLGHMTGRLLLKREGYPLDFQKVIDACADNQVIIEINANPRRLDIDWRWAYYALEKGALLSINPDAHHVNGIDDMIYGVHVARKAGIPKEMIFNTKSRSDVDAYFSNKK